MSAQPNEEYSPRFKLGEMAILDGAVVRVLGREQFVPGNMWFYLLGARVGKQKMKWHTRVPEFELAKPEWDNVVELRAPTW